MYNKVYIFLTLGYKKYKTRENTFKIMISKNQECIIHNVPRILYNIVIVIITWSILTNLLKYTLVKK